MVLAMVSMVRIAILQGIHGKDKSSMRSSLKQSK